MAPNKNQQHRDKSSKFLYSSGNETSSLFSSYPGILYLFKMLSSKPKDEQAVLALAKTYGVPYSKIGKVTTQNLRIGSLINLTSQQIEQTYRNAIPRRMQS